MTLRKKSIRILLLALVVAALCVVPAFASSAGNVADAVEQTWTDAAGQIKTVVNTVVFPRPHHGAGDCILCQGGTVLLRLPQARPV